DALDLGQLHSDAQRAGHRATLGGEGTAKWHWRRVPLGRREKQVTPPVRSHRRRIACDLPVGARGLDALVGVEQLVRVEALADLAQAVVGRAGVEALAVDRALGEVEVGL